MYTTGNVCKIADITNHTLQSWMKRHPDLIQFDVSTGGHRRFSTATLVQMAVAKMIRDNSTFSVKRALEIGKIFADYDGDVRIHDEVVMLVDRTDVVIGPQGHRKFLDDKGFPRAGMYFRLTDLHRDRFGPHKPRDPETENERRQRLGFEPIPDGVRVVKEHLRGAI
jgi:DNA-binding transcriptional MerR regulator